MKLGDEVAEPVVLTGKYDDALMVPVKVVTSKRRKVSIVVLGGYAYQDGEM